MTRRRSLVIGTAVAATAAAGVWLAERLVRRRVLPAAGQPLLPDRTLPSDTTTRTVPVSDGGAISVIERGRGPVVVLVHGIWLGARVWAPQLSALGEDHRVVAYDQRGHGASVAGTDGYAMDRLAADLLEVLEALDVTDATLAGHSLGGMVTLVAALDHAPALARRVRRLVLVATTAGPTVPAAAVSATQAAASWSLGRSERRGRTVLPTPLAVWGARASFGASPWPVDVELVRSLLDDMAPGALSGLVQPLLRFDVRDRLAEVDLPTVVVAGTRDLITPPRTARTLAARVRDAAIEWLEGCGHMVMLEREDELCRILA